MPAPFQQHLFYHGTSLKAARSIARQGFQVWFQDEALGRYPSGGNLGNGIYLTCNWRMALWFGPTLLRISLRPGTRLLNAALPPDPKVLDYLQREFGREVLRKAPWKVLPKNKKLKRNELINLFRYHYRRTWDKAYGRTREGFPRWPRLRKAHAERLDDFKSMLIRYGYHGYGNPEDDNGIVVFAGDRLVLQEVIAEIPDPAYASLHKEDFRSFRSISEVKAFFDQQGSQRAKRLAGKVARASAGEE